MCGGQEGMGKVRVICVGSLKYVCYSKLRMFAAFIKTLNETLRSRIVCIVDIDPKKIRSKFYINNYLNIKIPIVHFTKLNVAANIDDKQENPPKKKLRKETDDIHIDYGSLPVVVCVAMYRTKGLSKK